MAEQKAARSKKAKRPDRRPTHQRYTATRRWMYNQGMRMRRTALAQPNNQQVRERLRALQALHPTHYDARGL